MKHVAIIGGGAAGFFAALTAAELDPSARITIYERGQNLLSKVKISGGGRCNVTHSCFDPAKLASHYPRGSRELRAAFHYWQPQDTLDWFAARGVSIKREADGRMFPTTDDSQTIINCFLNEARKAKIQINRGISLKNLTHHSTCFTLHLSNNEKVKVDRVCIAVGSLKASPLTRAIEALGHTIEPLVPSLFAFNLADKRTHGLSGLSVANASVSVRSKKSKPQSGPLLITHRGLSGPAILRTSAWEARALNALNYHFDITINWLGNVSENQLRETFIQLRKQEAKKAVKNTPLDPIPRRLWERLCQAAGIADDAKWAQLSKKAESLLIAECINGTYSVQGKTTNKDEVKDYLRKNGLPKYVPSEFVHCGGISRKEIDWRTMESKICPGLYFAGECIDIDGLTGGFNFQSAWTTAHIAGLAMGNADT